MHLYLFLEDGHMGFPGNFEVYQYISIAKEGVLDIKYLAATDRATPCSFSNHLYFNLNASKTIDGHHLKIMSNKFLDTDQDLIPTKLLKINKNSNYNFNKSRKIRNSFLLDHNFCLSSKPKRIHTVAVLKGNKSGIKMKLKTTEVGLQVYNGSNINGRNKLTNGRLAVPFSGLALEPQFWPDSPNQNFPSNGILLPGSIYEQHTKYCFLRK